MSKKQNDPDSLRVDAEMRLAHMPQAQIPDRGPEELLHELQVHHVELEMQNDELRRTQLALEESRDRYVSLFEFAPAAYLTLTREGVITEANLTAAALFGVERKKLLKRGFSGFVGTTHLDHWQRRFLHALQHEERQNCELVLRRSDDSFLHARLDCQKIKVGDTSSVRIAITDITELKQAEEELRIAAIAFESQEGIVVTDANSVILRTNRAFTRLTGYSQEEALGKTPAMLKSGRQDQAFYQQMWEALKQDHRWQGEIWNKHKDGTIYAEWLSISAVIAPDGRVSHYIGAFLDITESKRVEARALAAESQLTAMLNAIPDQLFEMGLDGRFHAYHTSRPELLAVPPETFIGMTVRDFFTPEAASTAINALHEADEKGNSMGKQLKFELPQGAMWFELSVARKSVDAGEAPRFIVLSRDITERKKLEKEIMERRNEMDELQKLHVASMTAAAIAHELNQPLLAIASYSEAALMLLRAGAPNLDKVRKAVEGSERQAHRAGQSIRELLDFLRLKEFSTEDFDLNREILDTLNAAKTEHEIQFHSILKMEQKLPPIRANRTHVQKVLLNLLRNGIEAMRDADVPQPSITVTVRTMKDESVAQITITDNGPGFRKEDAQRLFEPFFTTKAKGIGIGLATSRSLIEANEGRLWVDPQEGPGATFHLTLPFAT